MKKLKDELAESQKKLSNNNDNSNKENSKLSKINKLAELRCKLCPFESLSSSKIRCCLFNI